MTKFTNALLDMNGVIINDEGQHEEVFALTLESHGINLTEEKYNELFLGKTDRDGLLSAAEEFEISFDIEETLIKTTQHYQELFHNSSESIYYSGIKKFIDKLLSNFTVGIVASSVRDEVDLVVDDLDLREDLAVIASGDDVSSGKPSPEPCLKAVKELKIDTSQCFIV